MAMLHQLEQKLSQANSINLNAETERRFRIKHTSMRSKTIGISRLNLTIPMTAPFLLRNTYLIAY